MSFASFASLTVVTREDLDLVAAAGVGFPKPSDGVDYITGEIEVDQQYYHKKAFVEPLYLLIKRHPEVVNHSSLVIVI